MWGSFYIAVSLRTTKMFEAQWFGSMKACLIGQEAARCFTATTCFDSADGHHSIALSFWLSLVDQVFDSYSQRQRLSYSMALLHTSLGGSASLEVSTYCTGLLLLLSCPHRSPCDDVPLMQAGCKITVCLTYLVWQVYWDSVCYVWFIKSCTSFRTGSSSHTHHSELTLLSSLGFVDQNVSRKRKRPSVLAELVWSAALLVNLQAVVGLKRPCLFSTKVESHCGGRRFKANNFVEDWLSLDAQWDLSNQYMVTLKNMHYLLRAGGHWLNSRLELGQQILPCMHTCTQPRHDYMDGLCSHLSCLTEWYVCIFTYTSYVYIMMQVPFEAS